MTPAEFLTRTYPNLLPEVRDRVLVRCLGVTHGIRIRRDYGDTVLAREVERAYQDLGALAQRRFIVPGRVYWIEPHLNNDDSFTTYYYWQRVTVRDDSRYQVETLRQTGERASFVTSISEIHWGEDTGLEALPERQPDVSLDRLLSEEPFNRIGTTSIWYDRTDRKTIFRTLLRAVAPRIPWEIQSGDRYGRREFEVKVRGPVEQLRAAIPIVQALGGRPEIVNDPDDQRTWKRVYDENGERSFGPPTDPPHLDASFWSVYIPAEALPVVRAEVQRIYTRKVAKVHANKPGAYVPAYAYRPGDLLIVPGRYVGPDIFDIERVVSVDYDPPDPTGKRLGKNGKPVSATYGRLIVEVTSVGRSDVWNRTRHIRLRTFPVDLTKKEIDLANGVIGLLHRLADPSDATRKKPATPEQVNEAFAQFSPALTVAWDYALTNAPDKPDLTRLFGGTGHTLNTAPIPHHDLVDVMREAPKFTPKALQKTGGQILRDIAPDLVPPGTRVIYAPSGWSLTGREGRAPEGPNYEKHDLSQWPQGLYSTPYGIDVSPD